MILAMQQHQGSTITAAQMEVLQDRAITLREAIAKFEAQRPIYERQTRVADPATRAMAENQIVQMDLQIASSKAELGSVVARIEAAGGEPIQVAVPGTSEMPPPPMIPRTPFGIDPDAVTAVFVMTSIAILLPLSVGIARRLWRRPPAPMPTQPFDDMKLRMERLEQAVDAVAIEVERVAESQRFVAKVLVERPTAGATAAPGESAQAIGEAKPFLALGAGPVEPIPVAQRQAVRQSNTPH
jgi:hypothetical protein